MRHLSGVRRADDLAGVVDVGGMGETAAEMSQGGYDAIPPDERRPAVDVADDLPGVVDSGGRARFSLTEGGREADDAAVVPEHGAAAGRRGRQRGHADDLSRVIADQSHEGDGRWHRKRYPE